jgi:hypothetical protein
MSNPWLKKNPFMSLWLSGANKVAGSARAQVAAEAKRRFNATVAQVTEDNLKRWFDTPAASRRKTRSKTPRR